MEEEIQPTCWAGLQVIGTLLGTMFGFASSAVLSKFLGGGILPAVPGVVIGSSMGVLSAYFAGESGLPQREMLYKTARSFGAALALTMIYAGLLRPVMSEGGAVIIVTLATVASFGSSAVLICNNYKSLLGGTVAAGNRDSLPHVDIKAKDGYCPKEV